MLSAFIRTQQFQSGLICQTCANVVKRRGFLNRLTTGWDQSAIDEDKKSVGSWFKTRVGDLFGSDKSITQYRDMSIQDFQKFIKQASKSKDKTWMSLVGSSMTGYFRQKTRDYKKAPYYVNPQGPQKYKAYDEQIAEHRLAQYDKIIKSMTAEDKQDPLNLPSNGASLFRLANLAKCSTEEVKDCIEKYRLVKQSVNRILDYQEEGRPLPESTQEFQQMMGEDSLAGAVGILAGDPSKKLDWKDFEGCPLEGKGGNRNTRCPKTGQRWKRCCGGPLGVKHLYMQTDPSKITKRKFNPKNRHAPENQKVII